MKSILHQLNISAMSANLSVKLRTALSCSIIIAVFVGLARQCIGNYWNNELIDAIKSCSQSRLERALTNGADPEVEVTEYRVPLNLIQRLNMALHHDREGISINSAFSMACRSGTYEMVCLLIAHHAKLNLRAENGYMPIHNAAINADSRILRLFIKNRSNLDSRTASGDTPLMVATYTRHYQNMELLLRCGANLRSRNSAGQDALEIAMEWHDRVAIRILKKWQALHRSSNEQFKHTDL